MTSCDPAPRDIWLAYVEFADHEGVGKVRPVVILDSSGKASVITAKITASANYEPSSFVEISDWESCGLRRPSRVQIEPLVEVRRDKLLRDEPLGQLSPSTYDLVCAALNSSEQNEDGGKLQGRLTGGIAIELSTISPIQPNPYAKRLCRPVTMRIDVEAIDYFKEEAAQHPLPEPDKPLLGAMRRGEEGSRVRLGHA